MNKRYSIILLSTLIIWGCSHGAKYIEPPKETAGLATIEGSTKFYVALLRTTPNAIDNEVIVNPFVRHTVTPGHHDISLCYGISGAWFPFIQYYSVRIMAEPDHRYIARGNFWGMQKAWVEDMGDPKIRWEAKER